MPVVLRIRSIVFYFYSREHLPIHVHIKAAERKAKIEVESGKVVYNKGFSKSDMKLLKTVVENEKELIKESWNEYFKNKEI